MMNADRVVKLWEERQGSLRTFTRMLDEEGVEHISFSMINALETCPQRYLLEYVDKVKIRPQPSYFVKGRLMHEAAAKLHRARGRGRVFSIERLQAGFERKVGEEDAIHLGNAIALMSRQLEGEWEVVAVEEPFMLDLGPDLPICIGVVDLVERRGDEYRVIDHKSGRDFWGPSPLQLALYREHVRRKHGARRCLAYFDEYRWVNDLGRIRKPAHRRTPVNGRDATWSSAVRRITSSYRRMKEIRETRVAPGLGNCMACHYRWRCPKGWW